MSDALALPETRGFPLAIRGGQKVAHCPVQALFPFRSFLNRYSVRPLELTRICPRPVFAVETTGPVA